MILNYMGMERGLDLSEADKKEALSVYYKTIYSQRKLYEDTVPVLDAMQKAGLKLGIVSNTTNPPDMKRYELALFGLEAYFDFGIYSSEVPFRKPHPSIFKLAVRKMDLLPEKVLFVGDSYEADIVGAHRVGMATAWVNRDGRAKPEGPVPDFTLSALAEGYEVFVVTDASGTFNPVTRDAAWDRMSAAGAQLMSWFGAACELHRDWRNDIEGLGALFSNHIPDYRNLITSYTTLTAGR